MRARRGANWKDGAYNLGNTRLLELGGTIADNLGLTPDTGALVLKDGDGVGEGVG